MTTEEHVVSTLSRRNLPNGWAFSTISGLVGAGGVFVDGDWVETEDQDPTGEVRLIQLADIGDGYYRDRSRRFLTYKKALELRCTFLRQNDLLIARMPDPLGRACIFPGDPKTSVTVVDVCIVRTGDVGADHRWLMYTINSPDIRAAIASLQSGSTRKRISRNNLAKIQIPVPPLPEQYRIVAEIETQFTRLDAGVAALKRVHANLRRYKASVLKAACEGLLVPTEAELARAEGREFEPASVLLERILTERRVKWELANPGKRYVEPKGPDVDELTELPEGWVWAKMDAITASGPQNGLYLPLSAYGKGAPILRIDDYQSGASRRSDELRRVDASPDQLARYSLELGDMVINRVNSPSHLGKCLVIAPRNLPSLFESNMLRLRLANGIDARYAHFFLWSEVGRQQLIKGAKWAVNQASINQQDVARTPIPVPPVLEQRRIVAEVERRLSVVQEVEATVAANLKRAERLRQSILKRAFEGRLVPQDSSDEPASALLERIRSTV